MIQATRSVTVRDFVIFQLKLVMDGLKDVILFQVAIGALLIDLLAGGGKRPRVFYSVLRSSERFDHWLSLHGAAELLESDEVGEDGLFGASKAGSDGMLGKVEQMVRGGDEPRGKKGASERSDAPPRGGAEGQAGHSSGERPHAKADEQAGAR